MRKILLHCSIALFLLVFFSLGKVHAQYGCNNYYVCNLCFYRGPYSSLTCPPSQPVSCDAPCNPTTSWTCCGTSNLDGQRCDTNNPSCSGALSPTPLPTGFPTATPPGPSPTPRPSPTPTRAPTPTPTRIPTVPPSPTPSGAPTSTPGPSPTPRPTSTPGPSPTSSPTPTPFGCTNCGGAGGGGPTPTPIPAGCAPGEIPTIECLQEKVGVSILWALYLAGVVALIFVIYAGIKYITAGGNPEKVNAAKTTLTYAIIGAILLAFSYVILWLIGKITGAPIL